MSTRSNISVKIDPRDYGKTLRHNGNEEFYGEVKIPTENTDGMYLSIYHHHDGYPSGLGETLLNQYNTYEKALDAVLGGDCSSLLDDNPRFYCEMGETFKSNKPRLTIDPEMNEEFAYKFENGEWWWASCYDSDLGIWQKLKEIAVTDENEKYIISTNYD